MSKNTKMILWFIGASFLFALLGNASSSALAIWFAVASFSFGVAAFVKLIEA